MVFVFGEKIAITIQTAVLLRAILWRLKLLACDVIQGSGKNIFETHIKDTNPFKDYGTKFALYVR